MDKHWFVSCRLTLARLSTRTRLLAIHADRISLVRVGILHYRGKGTLSCLQLILIRKVLRYFLMTLSNLVLLRISRCDLVGLLD